MYRKYKINYDNRIFRSKSNSSSGEVTELTQFNYRQEDHILSAKYAGGQILSGQMLGFVDANGTLRFNYHHINISGQLRSGYCESVPEILKSGAILLRESWQWMDGNRERGESIVVEVLS